MSRILDAIAPPRLGTSFRKLIGSFWSSNLADGIAIAAGPLLIEAETGDASLVGLTWLLGRLPFLLFSLPAGYIADRVDRRYVMIVAHLFRILVLTLLTLVILGDQVSVGLIMGAMFLLGVAEAFSDNTANTFLPMLVEKKELTLGNSRLMFGHVGLNLLIGPPIGAALFAVGMWIPFAVQVPAMVLAGALVWRIMLPEGLDGAAVEPSSDRSARKDILDGVKWVWGHPAIRTLALSIFFFNITFGGSFSVLVVLAKERLALGDFGFGLLTGMSAIGGIIGTIFYKKTEARLGVVTIMRAGLVIEGLTHLVLAVSTTAALAFVMLLFFGVHEAMWGTTSGSIRQAAVPYEFQGRVGSVYMLGLQTGLLIGAGIGSVLAGLYGVTAPYWFGFVGTTIVLALVWRRLETIAGELADDS